MNAKAPRLINPMVIDMDIEANAFATNVCDPFFGDFLDRDSTRID